MEAVWIYNNETRMTCRDSATSSFCVLLHSRYSQCSWLTRVCCSLWLVIVKPVCVTDHVCKGGRMEDWLIEEEEAAWSLCAGWAKAGGVGRRMK